MNAVYANGELISSRFQVRGLVGQGDLGQVFEVWDLASANVAALKQFVGPAAKDAALMARVGDAARRAAAGTPALVKILHTGASEHGGYVVLERLGPSLEQRRPAPFQVGPAFAQLAEALDAAHASGLVHGDLHPRNVFLVPDGRLRVTDFGVWALRAAAPNPWPGLPGWTAPEVVQLGTPSARSDIYSFALLLFYALTGSSCFRCLGTGRVDTNALWAEMNAEPDPVARSQELRIQLNPGSLSLIGRALSVDPEARPQSAEELVMALNAAEPTGGHAAGTLVMSVSELAAAQAPLRPQTPRPPSSPPSSELPARTGHTAVGGGTVAMPAPAVLTPAPPKMPSHAPMAPNVSSLRSSGTIVANASAFPELAVPPAATPASSGQHPMTPVPAPPPVVRQTRAPEPTPPPLVDPSALPSDQPLPIKDWTTVAFAEAARAEWAQNAYQQPQSVETPESRNGELRAAVDRPRLQPTMILLVAGVGVLVLILALVLLYLLLRMDDASKFPAPKPNACYCPSSGVSLRGSKT